MDSSAKHLRMEVVEGLLEAHRQSESDDIKKSKIYAKSGTKFPYLGMVVSTFRICLSLSLDDNRKVFVGPQDIH